MLVIGFNSKDNSSFARNIAGIDLDIDSPRHIHDLLKAAANGTDFTHIVLVEEDTVIAEFSDEEDYDLTEPAEVDDADESDDDSLLEDEERDDEDE